jgi:hypothetical protein
MPSLVKERKGATTATPSVIDDECSGRLALFRGLNFESFSLYGTGHLPATRSLFRLQSSSSPPNPAWLSFPLAGISFVVSGVAVVLGMHMEASPSETLVPALLMFHLSSDRRCRPSAS